MWKTTFSSTTDYVEAPPSDPKSYDVVVKIPATCAEDWAVVPNVDVSATETFKDADIKSLP